LKVLGTLNEYQARLFVAERALELGRADYSFVTPDGMSRVTITQGVSDLSGATRLRAQLPGACGIPAADERKWRTAIRNSRQLREIVEETTAGDPMTR